jgi:hypothetical protein
VFKIVTPQTTNLTTVKPKFFGHREYAAGGNLENRERDKGVSVPGAMADRRAESLADLLSVSSLPQAGCCCLRKFDREPIQALNTDRV